MKRELLDYLYDILNSIVEEIINSLETEEENKP